MAVNIKVTKETAAVFLKASTGKHLRYKVSPRGSMPIFTLVDSRSDKLLMSNDDNPVSNNPLAYERRWPTPVDNVSTSSSHTLGIHFLGAATAATSYRYEVDLLDTNGQVERNLIDILYSSKTPEDWYFQALLVTTA